MSVPGAEAPRQNGEVGIVPVSSWAIGHRCGQLEVHLFPCVGVVAYNRALREGSATHLANPLDLSDGILLKSFLDRLRERGSTDVYDVYVRGCSDLAPWYRAAETRIQEKRLHVVQMLEQSGFLQGQLEIEWAAPGTVTTMRLDCERGELTTVTMSLVDFEREYYTPQANDSLNK